MKLDEIVRDLDDVVCVYTTDEANVVTAAKNLLKSQAERVAELGKENDVMHLIAQQHSAANEKLSQKVTELESKHRDVVDMSRRCFEAESQVTTLEKAMSLLLPDWKDHADLNSRAMRSVEAHRNALNKVVEIESKAKDLQSIIDVGKPENRRLMTRVAELEAIELVIVDVESDPGKPHLSQGGLDLIRDLQLKASHVDGLESVIGSVGECLCDLERASKQQDEHCALVAVGQSHYEVAANWLRAALNPDKDAPETEPKTDV